VITWLHILGGLMILWLPITGLIGVGKEDISEGVKCFAALFSAILVLGFYLGIAWWLITL
jgi:hypothetical protein